MALLCDGGVLSVGLTVASTDAEAQTCQLPSNTSVSVGGNYFQFFNISGFAFGTYIFDVSSSGSFAPIGLNVQGFPGVTFSNGTKGFIGTGTSMGVSFNLLPSVTVGSTANITIRIINVAGQVVCGTTFTVTASVPPGWTAWLDRDNPSGSGDYELLAFFSPAQVCSNPIAVEGRIGASGTPFGPFGGTPQNFYTFSPTTGLGCRNSDQPGANCFDYQVRFFCP